MYFKIPMLLFPVLLASANTQVDIATILNVFGKPESSVYQAQVVTPENQVLVDLDYWDSFDEFHASPLDYDRFDWSLTKRIAASSNGNFLLSPLSLKLVLAVLTEAATQDTQSELSSVLDFDTDRNKVRSKFSIILNSLESKSPQYILDLGTRIYVSTAARQRFASVAQDHYRTAVKKADFSNAPVVVEDINSWVSNVTHGRITDLVNEDDVRAASVLILNTLFFKGSWRHQFPPNQTKPGMFYVSPTQQKETPFMKVKNAFFYSESVEMDAKILRMPYLGNKYSMYILVPNTLTGLSRILENLSSLRSEVAILQKYIVDVTLPKFQFDNTSVLDEHLKQMGIRQAFTETASFPGITRGQTVGDRLKVSRVLQRSGIEVNELGTVAYAATEISLVNKFGEDGEEVLVNKPFLFFVEDEATRQLLFTGRVVDPTILPASAH